LILKWGSYQHADSEVSISISKERRYNEFGAQIGYRERWTITGFLQAADHASLTTAILALEAAYATNGRDLVLYLPDGTTPTAHRLLSGVANTGTRVVTSDYPVGTGAEYSTFRSYQIVVEADVQANDGDSPQVGSFDETVVVTGGGPRKVWVETLSGAPIQQTVRAATTLRVTQSGSLTSPLGWLTPPGPLLPASVEHLDRRRIERQSPQRGASGLLEYRVAWSYEFETTAAVGGLTPHLSN